VKTMWTPTLTDRQALAICGSLSNPSKMPGHGYALPAYRCRLGASYSNFRRQFASIVTPCAADIRFQM
jgi:hypothetical protein